MLQELLRSLIPAAEFYSLQLQSISQTPGNDSVLNPLQLYHSVFIFLLNYTFVITSITEDYEVLYLLEPKTAESSCEYLLPRWDHSFCTCIKFLELQGHIGKHVLELNIFSWETWFFKFVCFRVIILFLSGFLGCKDQATEFL